MWCRLKKVLSFYLVGFLVLVICYGNPAQAQELSPVLPPEAQKAMTRGLEAVKQQEWDLVIKYFREAHEIAPLVPTVFYNLGLAHAKANNELLANAWLRAYLAASPEVANAEAIRQEILRLEIAAEKKIKDSFERAIAAAEQLPDDKTYDRFEGKHSVFATISGIQQTVGDVQGAEITAKRSRALAKAAGAKDSGQYEWKFFWSFYGLLQANAGDIEGAEQTALKVDNASSRNSVLAKIGEAKVAMGDVTEAWELIQEMENPPGRWFLKELITAYVEEDDLVRAEAAAAKASSNDKIPVMIDFAALLLRSGNVKKAIEVVQPFLSEDKEVYASNIDKAQLNAIAGNPKKALKIMAEAPDNDFEPRVNEFVLREITKEFVYLGDAESAAKAAALAKKRAPSSKRKGGPNYTLAEAYALYAKGNIDKAIRKAIQAEYMPHGSEVAGEFCKDILPFSIQTGNLEAAEKIADEMLTIRQRIDWFRRIANAYKKHGDTENAVRLREAVRLLDEGSKGGWSAKSQAQEDAVVEWVETALALEKKEQIRDLQVYLEKIKSEDAYWIPRRMAFAAKEWKWGLIKIRAQEKRLNR